MPYKVWIQVAKTQDLDESENHDSDADEDVGLPDAVTEELETLGEAQAVVRDILAKYNPDQLVDSDHREGGISDDDDEG